MKKIFLVFIIIFISACASNALTWQDGTFTYVKSICKQENQGKYWGECYLDKRLNDPNYEKIVSYQERSGYPIRKRWEQIIEFNEMIKDKIADGASYKEVNKIFEDVINEFNSSFAKYQEEKAAEQARNWAIALGALGGTAANLQNNSINNSNNRSLPLSSSSSEGVGAQRYKVCKYGFGINEKVLTINVFETCPASL
jgi:hypothetical protein